MCYKPKANIFFMISIVYYVCKVKSNIFYYITKYGFQRKYGRFVHMCLAFVINHDYHIYARVMVSGHFFYVRLDSKLLFNFLV